MYVFLATLFLSWGSLHVYVNSGSPCPWNEVASSTESLRGLKVCSRRHRSLLKGEKTASSYISDPFLPLPFAYRAPRGGPYFCKLHILCSPLSIHFSASCNLILGCSNLPVVNKQRTTCWKTDFSQLALFSSYADENFLQVLNKFKVDRFFVDFFFFLYIYIFIYLSVYKERSLRDCTCSENNWGSAWHFWNQKCRWQHSNQVSSQTYPMGKCCWWIMSAELQRECQDRMWLWVTTN